MHKHIAWLLALVLVMGGCSKGKGNSEPPKVAVDDAAINIQLGGEPDTLDPAFAATPDTQSYMVHLFEGLTTLTDTLEPTPGVAASWAAQTSDTGLTTYTFKLDEKAKWSDGEQVKAQDFIYAWTRMLDPATKSPIAYKLYPIRGAQAYHTGTNKKTESAVAASDSSLAASSQPASSQSEVQKEDKPQENPNGLGLRVGENGELVVELEGQYPDLLQRIADPAWVPLRESTVSRSPSGWYYDAKNYTTNGPYTLAVWERDESISMQKSKTYRNANSVKALRLNFVLTQDSELLLGALRDKTVQLATDLPQLELEKVAEEPGGNVVLGGYSLVVNTQNKPFNQPAVRRALSLALDRTALAAAMRDSSTPATGLIPSGAVVDGVDLRKQGGELVQATAKTDEAKALLKKAGYTPDAPLAVKYLVSDQPAHLRMAQNIAAAWEPLGIKVELEQQKWDAYTAYREDGKFDVTHLSLFSDTLYPAVFADSWTTDSPSNFAQYQNHAYDVLIDLSYGREPRPEPTPAVAENAGASKEGSTAESKPESKAESKAETSPKADAEADGEKEPEEQAAKSPAECITEAEKLLVQQDAAVIPISWYTNAYLTCDSGFGGFKSYPTGYMYFGTASYTAPKK